MNKKPKESLREQWPFMLGKTYDEFFSNHGFGAEAKKN